MHSRDHRTAQRYLIGMALVIAVVAGSLLVVQRLHPQHQTLVECHGKDCMSLTRHHPYPYQESPEVLMWRDYYRALWRGEPAVRPDALPKAKPPTPLPGER